jgi:RNA polymerase sigma-70 factor (ECF subfamily)
MSDADLLERFYREKDNEWLGILLQRYTLLLLGVCMKYLKDEDEARDAVQQVFLKVLQELSKYRVEFFKSWLYMVAKNHCLMRIREKQGKPTAELTDIHSRTAQEENDRAQLLQNDQTLSVMEEALHELNPEQRQCVTLFYLQKKSYQEVSQATGYSMLQVKSYIQNGKRNLRLLIEKKLNPSLNRK